MSGIFRFPATGAGLSDIGTRLAAESARDAASEARTQTAVVGADVERLLLITEAVWSFLKEKHGYTDDDLIKRIAEIDLRDGKLDGRVAPSSEGGPSACPECGRTVGRKRALCVYCGAPLVVNPFAR